MQRLADIVGVALHGEGGLGHTVAAHGAGGGAVGVDGVGITLKIVAGVKLGKGAKRLGAHGMGVRSVSTVVGEQLCLPGHDPAVGPDIGDQMGADGVAHTVGDEGFLPGAFEFDRAAPHLGGAPGGQWLIQGILLVAEAAADVGLDDPDSAPGQTQRLPADTADDVGNLGGGNDNDPAVFLIGVAAVVFNVAVLHGGGVVPAFDFDEARLLNGLLVITLAAVRMHDDVAGAFLVNGRQGRVHCLLHIQHHGQRVIINFHQPDCLIGGNFVFRNHHGHIVAVVADVAVEQLAVSGVLMVGIGGPGMAGRGELNIGNVKAG